MNIRGPCVLNTDEFMGMGSCDNRNDKTREHAHAHKNTHLTEELVRTLGSLLSPRQPCQGLAPQQLGPSPHLPLFSGYASFRASDVSDPAAVAAAATVEAATTAKAAAAVAAASPPPPPPPPPAAAAAKERRRWQRKGGNGQ